MVDPHRDPRPDPRPDPLSSLRGPDPADWRHHLESTITRLREPRLRAVGVVAAAIVVLVVLGVAIASAVVHAPRSPSDERGVGPPSLGTIPMATTTSRPPELAVHAAGALVSPGLYHLRGSPRVADLIDAAGGLAPDADIDRINLAAPLSDGSRLYVPRRGESSVPPVVAGGDVPGGGSSAGSTGAAAKPGQPGAQPLDLNTATAEQLDALPGVGPATAAAIVDYRRQHGPFRSVDGLLQVRGIGPAKLDAIKGLVRV